ncbi:MAG: hypothetical protein JWO43_85 [Candidatus Adlerbacteria bacterium]|nr:hypothetical protein [Candidatus Adlerbacteria bacterium]
MSRIIGIRHRTKMTVEEEARPTQVYVLFPNDKLLTYKLETEQDELNFLLGQFPTSFRNVEDGEDVSGMSDYHLKLRALKKGEADPEASRLRVIDRKKYLVQKVADTFDGLKAGDTVAMALGGSGDYFAYALARRGEAVGASVMRAPSFVLKDKRGEKKKEDDAQLFAELLQTNPELFYDTRPRDLDIIRLREAYRARIEAMKARIGCEQRLRQRFIGSIFCKPDGHFPEGAVEKLYDEAKANDAVLTALSKEEAARERELQKLVEASDVWKNVFGDVEGMGWAIASRIMAGVVDIRRFRGKEQFKAFAGVHVLKDGRFARRRSGAISNWHPDLRQALYLFGDQMNRRPDSVWGQKLLAYKAKFRAKHPEPIVGENGKKKYTDGHIHKMALWRTMTKFAEWLFTQWKRLEKQAARVEVPLRKAA